MQVCGWTVGIVKYQSVWRVENVMRKWVTKVFAVDYHESKVCVCGEGNLFIIISYMLWILADWWNCLASGQPVREEPAGSVVATDVLFTLTPSLVYTVLWPRTLVCIFWLYTLLTLVKLQTVPYFLCITSGEVTGCCLFLLYFLWWSYRLLLISPVCIFFEGPKPISYSVLNVFIVWRTSGLCSFFPRS